MNNNQYNKSNPETIKTMFSTIANNYDKANAILSFNLHKYWNRQLVKKVLAKENSPSIFLDLCSGTGDIGFEIMKHQKKLSEIYFLDFCTEMLECAKKKANNRSFNLPHKTAFIQGDAQEIPFENEKIDCITIAYGIRNIKTPERCIKECYRTLKNNGVIGILELTEPTNKFLKFNHSIYLKKIMPQLGKLIATNKDAYEYLCNSIHTFIPPKELMTMLHKENFLNIEKRSLFGGIATILIAEK